MAKSKPAGASKSRQLNINLDEIKKASLVLRSVNHKMRQNMLDLIEGNKEMRVTDIYKKLKLEQSLTSSYLGLLRKSGVVTTRREGQVIYYSVNKKRLAEIEQGSKTINSGK